MESGIYRDVADLENVGRILYRKQPEFPEAINTLVRRGDHVLMEVDMALKVYMARDFTRTGTCIGIHAQSLPMFKKRKLKRSHVHIVQK